MTKLEDYKFAGKLSKRAPYANDIFLVLFFVPHHILVVWFRLCVAFHSIFIVIFIEFPINFWVDRLVIWLFFSVHPFNEILVTPCSSSRRPSCLFYYVVSSKFSSFLFSCCKRNWTVNKRYQSRLYIFVILFGK